MSASGGQNIPLICGSNDGEHSEEDIYLFILWEYDVKSIQILVYVDVGSESATAVLQFDFPNGDNVSNFSFKKPSDNLFSHS